MRDYLSLGPTPPGEDCIQVGDELYAPFARLQCEKYIEAIKAYHGEPPYGVSFKIKAYPHDGLHMGEIIEYYDVEVWYIEDEGSRYSDLDDDDILEEEIGIGLDVPEEMTAQSYAFACESHPQTWKEAGMKVWDAEALMQEAKESLIEKLHFSHYSNMSSKMAAIIGYILDHQYTEIQIISLCVTSDGIVMAGTSEDVLFNQIIGSIEDFEMNIETLIEAANLTAAEFYVWEKAYTRKHPREYN